MKLFLETYGCTQNKADALIIRGILRKHEFTGPAEARTVIINTCAVKNATESRMISRINYYISMKKKVIVAGCLPKVNPKSLKNLPVVLVDTNSLDKLPQALKAKPGKHFFSEKHANKLSLIHCQDKTLTGIIEISEGCTSRCAFCGTKNARGNLTSFPEKDILDYAECLVKQGKKELYLTAQDTGCYGMDVSSSLTQLLSKLVKIPGDFRMRVGMMNPHYAYEMKKGLIPLLNNEKLYKFMHVPIQSGSNRVLKLMNRVGSVEQFEKLCKELRGKVPDITIATDIIVGFPGETEKDFQQTISLLKKTKPDITNVSKFYARPKTAAAGMKKIGTEILKKRSVECSALARRISLENNERYVGKKLSCLVTGLSKHGETLCRAPNYKQVILNEKASGFIDVKINEAGSTHLKGLNIK